MKYESLQKMTVITGLLVFSLGICSYAEDKVSMMKEASLPKEKASEVKSGNVSDDKEGVSLMAVDGHPLDDDDFILSNVKWEMNRSVYFVLMEFLTWFPMELLVMNIIGRMQGLL